jgi:hypothetical protein
MYVCIHIHTHKLQQVVGGWDSSNTGHLLEIAHMKHVTGYHVDMADRIKPDGSIEHRLPDGTIEVTKVRFTYVYSVRLSVLSRFRYSATIVQRV